MIRHNRKSAQVDNEICELASLWILRVIFKSGRQKEFLRSAGAGLLEFLGISADKPSEEDLSALRQRLAALEKAPAHCALADLEHNLDLLQENLGLSSAERDILRFGAILQNYELISDACRLLGDLSNRQAVRAISEILDLDPASVQDAFKNDGIFARSELVKLNGYSGHLYSKIELLNESFINALFVRCASIDELFASAIKPCGSTDLTLKNYAHIKEDLQILLSFLKNAVRKRQAGVNVLLYGAAGTGKTELSKVLAKELRLALYEVTYENEHGYADEKDRLKSYRLAQSLLQAGANLLMYDEAEDAFSTKNDAQRQRGKAFVNRALETNKVPTIWITNDIYSMDDAVVRRFNLSLELGVPNERMRAKIIKNYSANLIGNKLISKLAKNEFVAPALVKNASFVVSSLALQNKAGAFERVINNTLKAQGHREIEQDLRQEQDDGLPSSYNPRFVNSSCNLGALVSGIKQSNSARICLYGVPGTGKSAYAKFIAKSLKKRIIVKKGSDLLSMWLGGTEKNIAQAFKEASSKKAVLVFDEVDSFLQDRSAAARSWEITQVNEMLVQMESFSGIFIATTNLIDNQTPRA